MAVATGPLWLFGNLDAPCTRTATPAPALVVPLCDADLVLPPFEPPQRISACDDHDLETEGLHPFQGRGATELDVLEGAVTNTGEASYVVGSLQLSPGIPPYFPSPAVRLPDARGQGLVVHGPHLGHGGSDQTDGYANSAGTAPGGTLPHGCPDALSGALST